MSAPLYALGQRVRVKSEFDGLGNVDVLGTVVAVEDNTYRLRPEADAVTMRYAYKVLPDAGQIVHTMWADGRTTLSVCEPEVSAETQADTSLKVGDRVHFACYHNDPPITGTGEVIELGQLGPDSVTIRYGDDQIAVVGCSECRPANEALGGKDLPALGERGEWAGRYAA